MPIKPYDGKNQYQQRKDGGWPRRAVGCHEYWSRKDLQQLKLQMELSLTQKHILLPLTTKINL
jgi:hypothetical protein